MADQFSRVALLLGQEGVARLCRAHVAVFGVGGVGGYVCEALARSGVGAFTLVDNDEVSLTNINRQIIALHSTVGRPKAEVMRERILDINPEARVTVRQCFLLPDNQDTFDFSAYDYVVDAIDTVAAKVVLAVRCREAGVPLIASMGAGNRLDGSRFRVTDLFETSGDPLARTMRHELRKLGIDHLKVVCSDEPARTPRSGETEEPLPPGKRSLPGSAAFAVPVAGLLLAGQVVRDLCGIE